jgi:hypothetical protein
MQASSATAGGSDAEEETGFPAKAKDTGNKNKAARKAARMAQTSFSIQGAAEKLAESSLQSTRQAYFVLHGSGTPAAMLKGIAMPDPLSFTCSGPCCTDKKSKIDEYYVGAPRIDLLP